MKLVGLFFALLLAPAVSFSQEYRVTPKGVIRSEVNCYTFETPRGWNVAIGNPSPSFINFSPRKLSSGPTDLPSGGADLGVVSAKEAHNGVKSLDEWVDLRKRGATHPLEQGISLPAETGITRARMLSWDYGDSSKFGIVARAIGVFFEFKGQPYQAEIDFNSNDSREAHYKTTLTTLLNSFRPLPACSVR